jgi:sigma-B regulation protein RsbU (phosphoserine phosphatase)
MDTTMTRYEEFAVAVLRLAYAYIDVDDMVEVLETGERSQQYNNTQVAFNTIKETQGITFLYFFAIRDNMMVYFINAYTQREVEMLGEDEKIVTLNSVDPLPYELNEMINNPDDRIWIIPTDTDYGHMMGAFYAIRDDNGNIIGILASEINMYDIDSTIQVYVVTVLLGAIIIISICVFFMILYIRKKVTLPIQRLSESANNFVNQETDEELKAIISTIKSKDELETLSESIEKMTMDMIEYIKNITIITAEKERIGAELSVATQIQASMLPKNFPQQKELELYASMRPAKEVGGDFYDFFFIDEDTLAVVMADVSGKGIPAALFMVVAKTLIKTNAMSGMSPKEVFDISNDLLCENNDAEMFVTAFLGYLQISTGRFKFVNAGHNFPLIKKKDKFEWLETEVDFVLAGMEGMPFTEGEITLNQGDELFLYTDGVTEAHNIDNDLFGDPYLLEVANECTYAKPNEFGDFIIEKIDAFAGEAPQADDITMMLLKYNG